MRTYYEHHLNILQDKLCPVHHIEFHTVRSCVYNWHQNIEVIRFCKDCTLQCGDREYAMHAGDMAVVNANALHRMYAEEVPHFYTLIIDESFCKENGIHTDKLCFTTAFRDAECFSLHEQVSEAFLHYRETGASLDAARLRIALLRLLVHLQEFHTESVENTTYENSPAEEYVKTVILYLNEHYTQDISLDDLAQICGVTKYHLIREFKRYTNQTILTFLNSLRCKNAEVHLKQGRSVTETAELCGFESVAYFSRTYKKYMDISPSGVKQKPST